MKTLTIGEQMKYLSKDLKDRIIKRYLDKDMTRKKVANYYEVSEALVKKVLAINLKKRRFRTITCVKVIKPLN